MTTNSPNPVDGDVQALVAECKARISAVNELERIGIPLLNDHIEDRLIAKKALAALTDAPVAWAHRLVNKRNGVVHPWVYGSKEKEPSEGDIFRVEIMPLYAAPPAQLLRPVDLPEFVYDPEGEPFLHRDEVVELLRSLGHEVKS